MFLTNHRFTAALVALLLVMSPLDGLARAGAPDAPGLHPSITFVGGTPTDHALVGAAVERFVANGLALPDLDVRFHADTAGCSGLRGVFRPNGGSPVVDLCFGGEFLVLHELGHAWVHTNLDGGQRMAFQEYVGAPSWRSTDTPHGRRGTEIAADAIAHGLLSAPLASLGSRTREFDRFEALTGQPSPRLAEWARAAAGEGA